METPLQESSVAKTETSEISPFKWYAVQVFSNMEKRVAAAIKENAQKEGLSESIEEVLVPTQDVTEVRRGKKIQAERKVFPGYILVRMILTDATHQLIQQIQWTSSFLGSGSRPVPIPQAQVDRILAQMNEGVSLTANEMSFEVGEEVRITDGPFDSFTGVVDALDEEHLRLKVLVSILGRITPVDIGYDQVEKIS